MYISSYISDVNNTGGVGPVLFVYKVGGVMDLPLGDRAESAL